MFRKLYVPLTLLLVAGHLPKAAAQEAAPNASGRAANASVPVRPFQVAYLRASLGVTSTLGWEYRCPRLAVEYAPMLTRHLGLAGRLVGVAGHPTASTPLYGNWIEQVPNQNYRAGFVEAEGLFYPFGNTRRVRFAIGLGGYAGYYKLNAISSANVVAQQVVAYELTTEQGGAVGYLGSLNVEVALGKQRRWLVGLKVTRQKGLGGITNLPGQSLTIARQL